MEAAQADHLGVRNGLVTECSYDWLRFQDEEQERLVSAQARSRQPSFLSMDTWSRKSLIGRLWNDGIGLLHGARERAAQRYEIEYSVFQPASAGAAAEGGDEVRGLEQFRCVVSDCVEAIKDAGIDLQRIASGSSGSYFAYGTDGRVLGVFKPKDEEPYGPLSPKWTKWLHRTFFPCFFGRSCLIPNLGYLCEAAASLLDRRLRTDLVPWTDTVVLESMNFYDSRDKWFCGWNRRAQRKIGSFQLFLEGYVGADVFLQRYPLPGTYTYSLSTARSGADSGDFSWTESTLHQLRVQLEKLIILDYIMRNTDRGLDNWMINVREVDGAWQLRLAAIDNGLSFPWKHPDEWRSYPYGWLYLPLDIINQPFTRETREHFLPILRSVGWWETSYLEFHALFSRDAEFKERMWKKQWAVVKGQAFNVLETLKHPGQGPLELVRRTRCLVFDDVLHVPAQNPPLNIIRSAINDELPVASSPMILSSVPEGSILFDFAQFPDRKIPDDHERQSIQDDPSQALLPDMPSGRYIATKQVIVERLQLCNSKPPTFTWC
ncbi:AaceriAFR087Wp [[Ashbya] aceris (nom. inval.)]|nr:AaceriAFR087Wp [[Ashbya] aceris (nom. inval.)]